MADLERLPVERTTRDIDRSGFGDLLFRYTDALYRAESLDEIYEAALTAICDALGTSRASILQFNKQGKMRFVASRGLSQGYQQAVDGHSPWQQDEQGASVICIEDILRTDEDPAIISAILAENIRGLCFIPLAPDDKVVGKFMVYNEFPRRLDVAECNLALTIARQLGFALQNHKAAQTRHYLAALVEGSHDAIIAKQLDGTITSWNGGATQLFGFSAEEAIGQPITIIVPQDRMTEEQDILREVSQGHQVRSFETVRCRKGGEAVDVSLTVSPVRDRSGRIIGASKIARDISEKRQAAEAQRLLLAEMNHRVKNAYALTSSLIQISAPSAATPTELARQVADRLAALSRAHQMALTLPNTNGRAATHSLRGILSAICEPFAGAMSDGSPRVVISGGDAAIEDELVAPLGLLIHELATNAAKYGSLSAPEGRVSVSVDTAGRTATVVWQERGLPARTVPSKAGFGTRLINLTGKQLGAVERSWGPDGLTALIRVDRTSEKTADS